MARPIEVVVVHQNGWWSAICKDLEISGFGVSEQEALEALKGSLFSNISARIKAAEGASVQEMSETTVNGGQVVRRFPLAASRVASLA